MLPCNSMMVVELGANEAKIEAIMNDFVQVLYILYYRHTILYYTTIHSIHTILCTHNTRYTIMNDFVQVLYILYYVRTILYYTTIHYRIKQ